MPNRLKTALISLSILIVPLLSGCHVSVVQHLTIFDSKTANVKTTISADEQAYQVTASQKNSPFNPSYDFGRGVSVTRSRAEDGDHVVVAQRNVNLEELDSAMPDNFGIVHVDNSPRSFFTNRTHLHIQVPAMKPDSSSSQDPWAKAGQTLAASLVSIQFELSAPGKLTSNGETLPDGSASWNVSLTEPTTLDATIESPNIAHGAEALIGSLIALGILAMLALGGLARRIRKEDLPVPVA